MKVHHMRLDDGGEWRDETEAFVSKLREPEQIASGAEIHAPVVEASEGLQVIVAIDLALRDVVRIAAERGAEVDWATLKISAMPAAVVGGLTPAGVVRGDMAVKVSARLHAGKPRE